MTAERQYPDIFDWYSDLQMKFNTVFGSADITIDMHMHDLWIELSVMMKHMEKMKQTADKDSELYDMTFDIIERKLAVLDRYIKKMIK